MLVFFAFVILLTLTVVSDNKLSFYRLKNREDWFVDGINLFFQGILIPILQITVIYQLYQHLLANFQAALNLHPIVAFCLSFIFVDYLYYWNHRLFHTRWLWYVHQVHHTVTQMDVLGTSRNTLWTSFLIIYLWVHALFIYLLQDSSWYVAGVSLSSALDLWRHSAIAPTPTSLLYRWLSPLLILPQNHAWHHASSGICGNYGANFKLWDKIHGTYFECDKAPDSLGVETKLSLTQKLFLPF
ncbi:sterol desaturase family protein [Scytonema hofmannii FACHB-248]|uniref:Sterol desaturase family protein n=1 Tax=Scytonema hofmannii FACHB-248 TaxID=1842502 RepID=A0ABR8GN90_9CYAN|nr:MULTISPECIES: sterol desaturase family protein [Nostocales]MBD2604890.1 sterol desaturase family protein [Scytonema hofmannii FACHB-248]